MPPLPRSLTRYVKAREPPPIKAFDAFLAEHSAKPRAVRPAPTRTGWVRAFLPTVVLLGLVFGGLVWRVVG